MKRLDQILLIGSSIGFCWLAMQAVHELGHVTGALITGGTVNKVVLHPCTISRTDVYPNPHPLFEVWSGPITGCLLPLAAYILAKAARAPGLFLLRFFTGFCLVANGIYIGAAWLAEGGTDSGDLLRLGASHWQLVIFGLITTTIGFYLWHGIGPHFGFGEARGRVSRKAALTSVTLFVLLATIQLVIGSR